VTDTEKIRKRGRPRAFDRDRALDQAQTLFHVHGYEGVGVAALASAMGINPPSFYAAFSSKAQLFDEILSRYAQASPLLDVLDLPGIDPVTALASLLRNAASAYSADPALAGCLVLENGRSTDADAACRARGCRDVSVATIRDFVARSHPEQAQVVADYVAAVMSGLSSDARAGHATERLVAIADMAALAIRAMLEPEGR
jgi:TetR/AcrR family transcriptional repressor for divergent bdcA